VLDRIAALVNELSHNAGQKPAALGMGIPGLLDIRAGKTKFLPNLPTKWPDVPVRGILEPKVNCPVYILNDARLAALGELEYGFGRKYKNMVYFTLGTGIGGGVAIDGKLRLGPLGAAGEIGHQTIITDGPQCGCGNSGCLEAIASGPAITAQGIRLLLGGRAPKLHEMVDGDITRVTPKEMALAAAQGDEAVQIALVKASEFLGIGVANVITILHPDIVVFTGGVAAIGDLLFDKVRETVVKRVGMFPPHDVLIKPSELEGRAGTLGGIALAKNQGLL
jgi:glucokinase